MSRPTQDSHSRSPDAENALRQNRTASDLEEDTGLNRSRSTSNASSISRLVRTASIKILDSHPPAGAWAATANVTAKAPTVSDIKNGSYCDNGWTEAPQQMESIRRTNTASSVGQRNIGVATEGPRQTSDQKVQAMNSVRAGTAPINIAPVVEEEPTDNPQNQEVMQGMPDMPPQHDGTFDDNYAGGPKLSEVTTVPVLMKHVSSHIFGN